jgi:hypothetical protein
VGAVEALGGSTHDSLEDALWVGVQLVVPDSDDRPAFLPEELVTPAIAVRFGVLASVKFNEQLGLPAGKVGKVRTDRQLACEFWSQARDQSPKLALVLGGSVAQGAGALGLIVSHTAAHGSERI